MNKKNEFFALVNDFENLKNQLILKSSQIESFIEDETETITEEIYTNQKFFAADLRVKLNNDLEELRKIYSKI